MVDTGQVLATAAVAAAGTVTATAVVLACLLTAARAMFFLAAAGMDAGMGMTDSEVVAAAGTAVTAAVTAVSAVVAAAAAAAVTAVAEKFAVAIAPGSRCPARVLPLPCPHLLCSTPGKMLTQPAALHSTEPQPAWPRCCTLPLQRRSPRGRADPAPLQTHTDAQRLQLRLLRSHAAVRAIAAALVGRGALIACLQNLR